MNGNLNNNFIVKENQPKNIIQGTKIIFNNTSSKENKKQNNNHNHTGKIKSNKTTYDINHANILTNKHNNHSNNNLINNYIKNNDNIIKQNHIPNCVNSLNSKQKNTVIIRNKAFLANNISEKKRAHNVFDKLNEHLVKY